MKFHMRRAALAITTMALLAFLSKCSSGGDNAGYSNIKGANENGTEGSNTDGSSTDGSSTDGRESDLSSATDSTRMGDTSINADGMLCSYRGDPPHTCACADGADNDNDGVADDDDLHCFGPFDDDEETYATGMPGDNEGSKAPIECPFDGNSGTGNDGLCCNPEDPTTNVVPNGCDQRACCEVDLNHNGTGEHVGIFGECEFSVSCGDDGTHGCPCEGDGDCDSGQHCIMDGDEGAGFCSTCAPCTPDPVCGNPCDCGESCFGGFTRPEAECGEDDGDTDVDTHTTTDTDEDSSTNTNDDSPTCADGLTACPGGDGDCVEGFERCVAGCCYPRCEEGVTPCDTNSDCESGFMCVTGCCIVSVVVV
jgi:hypothetical protein